MRTSAAPRDQISEARAPLVRAACFLAATTSGGALLAQVYDIASLRAATILVVVPSCVALIAAWLWSRRRSPTLALLLAAGALGGLLGTIGYDVVRVPFDLAGQRVFAPIESYGVLIAGADMSSRFTSVAGWAYHFSNGITFGILYALVMRDRHWLWAVPFALLLETIALLSPFGRIYAISGNNQAIAIAYGAHVAYGVPLGLAVARGAPRVFRAAHPSVPWMLTLAVATFTLSPLLSATRIARDRRARAGVVRVEGVELNPDWLRIARGGVVRVFNPSASTATLRLDAVDTIVVQAGGYRDIRLSRGGIHQAFLEPTDSHSGSRSSFVIVEPMTPRD